MSIPPTAERGDFVQSFAKGLAVIEAFGADNAAMSLSEVARRTGLTRAAARRLLLTPGELGYAETDGRRFTLRPCWCPRPTAACHGRAGRTDP